MGPPAAAAAAWAAILEAARYLCWNSMSWRCWDKADKVEASEPPAAAGGEARPGTKDGMEAAGVLYRSLMWVANEVAVTEAGNGMGATTGGILDILCFCVAVSRKILCLIDKCFLKNPSLL